MAFAPLFQLAVAVMLAALWISGVSEAADGLKYFLAPDWKTAISVDTWHAALCQALLSCGVGFGVHLNFAIENEFRRDARRDALIIVLFNALVSIYSGIAAFCGLGILAEDSLKDVSAVTPHFIYAPLLGYSVAAWRTETSLTYLWPPLLFTLMLILTLLSLSGSFYIIWASVDRGFACCTNPGHKWLFSGLFIVGLYFGTIALYAAAAYGTDIEPFVLADKNIATALVYLALLEVLLVSWVFGMDRFFRLASQMGMDVGCRIRTALNIYFRYVLPAGFLLLTLWHFGWEFFQVFDTLFSGVAFILGKLLEVIPLIVCIFCGVNACVKTRLKPGETRLKKVLSPTDSWLATGGPPVDACEEENTELPPPTRLQGVLPGIGSSEWGSEERQSGLNDRPQLPEMPPSGYTLFKQ